MRIDVKTCSIYWCVFSRPKSKFLHFDNLKSMNLDLNISTKVNFSANNQGI